MALADIRPGMMHDAAHLGVRLSIGVIFIVHVMQKFDPRFLGALENWGLPPEMQVVIGLGELVPGIMLIVGVLSRISAAIIAIIMMGAIFIVKGATNFAGDGGVEFDVILLAGCLVAVVIGPGRLSIAHAARKIPRFLH